MLNLTEATGQTPIGVQEIAAMLGVERATVDQWRTRKTLIEPDWTVGGRPAWATSTIAEWAVATNRRVRVHGPGAGASNFAVWSDCEGCGRRGLFEVYIDDDGTVTQQATDERGHVVCDPCAEPAEFGECEKCGARTLLGDNNGVVTDADREHVFCAKCATPND